MKLGSIFFCLSMIVVCGYALNWIQALYQCEWSQTTGHMPISIFNDSTPSFPPPTNLLASHFHLPVGTHNCNNFVADIGLAAITGVNGRLPKQISYWLYAGDNVLEGGPFKEVMPPLLSKGNISVPNTLKAAMNLSKGTAHTVFGTHRFTLPVFAQSITVTRAGFWLVFGVEIARAPDTASGTHNEVRALYSTINATQNTTQAYLAVDRFGNSGALRHKQLLNWTTASVVEPWLAYPPNILSLTRRLAINIYAQCFGPSDLTQSFVLTNGLPKTLYDPSASPTTTVPASNITTTSPTPPNKVGIPPMPGSPSTTSSNVSPSLQVTPTLTWPSPSSLSMSPPPGPAPTVVNQSPTMVVNTPGVLTNESSSSPTPGDAPLKQNPPDGGGVILNQKTWGILIGTLLACAFIGCVLFLIVIWCRRIKRRSSQDSAKAMAEEDQYNEDHDMLKKTGDYLKSKIDQWTGRSDQAYEVVDDEKNTALLPMKEKKKNDDDSYPSEEIEEEEEKGQGKKTTNHSSSSSDSRSAERKNPDTAIVPMDDESEAKIELRRQEILDLNPKGKAKVVASSSSSSSRAKK